MKVDKDLNLKFIIFRFHNYALYPCISLGAGEVKYDFTGLVNNLDNFFFSTNITNILLSL